MTTTRLSLDILRRLRYSDERFPGLLTPEQFDNIFEECEALWKHSGNPADPHAKLTTDRCSDGYVDTLRVLRYSNLCMIMAGQLVKRLREVYNGPVDWVIGSDHAGASLSYAVSFLLQAMHDFTEKGPDRIGPNGEKIKTQVWKRHTISTGEVVLQVEELCTTTATLQAVREGIRAGNPHPVTFAPVSLCLVHRSPVYEFEGGPILHARHYDINSWAPEECPLCTAGSKRLRPKQHWAELTGRN